VIHYHGTPCGGPRQDAARFLSGRHALIPFPRPEDIGTAAEVCQSFCLDNGAFSAWKSGNPVSDWTEYYFWVDQWRRHPGFDWAIIPDVIDGNETENDRLISEWPHGKYGVPVWHMHESFPRLEELSRRWPRIALGSSGGFSEVGNRKWWDRMQEAMEWLCDDGMPRCKIHGLRMLDPAIFHRLPLASADSTNAVRNSSNVERFGQYVPPSNGARMSTIADRIESHHSAAVWVSRSKQGILCYEDDFMKGGAK
jgi:hypothetical protein